MMAQQGTVAGHCACIHILYVPRAIDLWLMACRGSVNMRSLNRSLHCPSALLSLRPGPSASCPADTSPHCRFHPPVASPERAENCAPSQPR
nr:hypothetical protein CFP56_12008 [Quercus suber]